MLIPKQSNFCGLISATPPERLSFITHFHSRHITFLPLPDRSGCEFMGSNLLYESTECHFNNQWRPFPIPR
jgi:hypothetical protein